MGLDRAVSRPGCSEQAELAGANDRRVAVLDTEFAVQGALMGFHGVQRDIEPLADLAARQSGSQQPKYLAFFGGELFGDHVLLVTGTCRDALVALSRSEHHL